MTTASSKNTSRSAGVGSVFLEKTKYAYIQKSDQQKGLPQPPLELPPDPDLPVLDLPRPETLNIPPLNLRTAISRRRSVRSYIREPITGEELSFLLWCTQRV
jgi:hypothetical protein